MAKEFIINFGVEKKNLITRFIPLNLYSGTFVSEETEIDMMKDLQELIANFIAEREVSREDDKK